MKNRSSATARTLAVIALVGSFVVLVVVVVAALDSGGSSDSTHSQAQQRHHREQVRKNTPATYTIQGGDTLTSIAHSTGVPVGQIERLNPEIDPQILDVGEELKLK